MNIVKALRDSNPYKGHKSQTAHDNSIGFYRACDILQRKFREQPADWKEGFSNWFDNANQPHFPPSKDELISWIEQNLLPAASQGLQLEQIEKICLAFSDWFINDNSLPVGGFNMWKDTPTGKALLSSISPSPWIDVNERLPEYIEPMGKSYSDGTFVKVAYDNPNEYLGYTSLDYRVICQLEKSGTLESDELTDGETITHWQPLPQPPKS